MNRRSFAAKRSAPFPTLDSVTVVREMVEARNAQAALRPPPEPPPKTMVMLVELRFPMHVTGREIDEALESISSIGAFTVLDSGSVDTVMGEW